MLTAPSTRSWILSAFADRRADCLLLLVFCAGGSVLASAQTERSRLPPVLPTTAAPYSSPSPTQHPVHRAAVTYTAGLLTVAASNSSLNQILRDIARQTGMKLTGAVTEERVFGTYGPASPSAVLSTLLDGTGSNLLIVQNASSMPTELILTQRVGGATPPNPNASSFDDNDSSAEDVPQVNRYTPPPPAQPVAAQPTNSRASNRTGTGGVDTNPAATSPSSTSQQLVFPAADATTPPATATITPTGPDPAGESVKTPQQIFEQLQRLRQQQTQQQKPQ